MIDNAYQRALQLLNDNMEAMERVAAYLLEHETMYAAEFEKVFNGESVEKAETPAEPVDTERSVGTQTEEVEPE